MKRLAFYLAALALSLTPAWADSLQTGDLVLLSMPCYACRLIEKTIGIPYSHVAIVQRSDETGQISLIMAAEPAVMRVSYAYISAHALSAPLILRMRSPELQKIARRAAFEAEKYVGTPYDAQFEWGDQSLYCAELIYYSFLHAQNDLPLFELEPMHFAPFTGEWQALLGHTPPEGQPGLSPANILHSDLLIQIEADPHL